MIWYLARNKRTEDR